MKSLYNRIISWFLGFAEKQHGYLAAGLLAVMAVLSLGSMVGNSATFDEVAHLSAGYAYDHFGDYRLNPEHPPLLKNLAALPLQFMHLSFPTQDPAWTTAANGQWSVGSSFLYHMGNNADEMLFWGRLPILLLALGFGVFLYGYSRRRWGTAVGLVILFFYTLSPNFIAHSTLVTTDVGASIFAFLAIAAFARYAEKPDALGFWLMTMALTGAQLVKFSLVMLYPVLGIMALVLVWTGNRPKSFWPRFKMFVGGLALASAISLVGVWLYYAVQVWHMPLEVQDRLIDGTLGGPVLRDIAHFLLSINHLTFMEPVAQYLLGLTLVFGRVAGGNVTYLNGEVMTNGSHLYFPELLVLKTQIAFLIMALIAGGFWVWRAYVRGAFVQRAGIHVRNHVMEWTLAFFGLFYFVVSVAGPLNLGIRHIMPVYLPMFVIVALGVVSFLRWTRKHQPFLVTAGFGLLLAWYGASTVLVYPSYLSYFNEFIGGAANADKYYTDSSVDWGQDLKRLKSYVVQHPQINHIAIDYFGGGEPAYYFCQPRYDGAGHLIKTAAGYDCSHSMYEAWH